MVKLTKIYALDALLFRVFTKIMNNDSFIITFYWVGVTCLLLAKKCKLVIGNSASLIKETEPHNDCGQHFCTF